MKNKKDILPQNLNLHLPEDLIIQILLSLPVRSVLGFKCVCKSWFSLISDPQFAKSHFDKALAPTHRLLTEYNHPREVNSNSVDIDAPLDDNSAKVVFHIPLPSPTPKYGCITDIVASCRGLVLLTSEYLVNNNFLLEFVIWNPSTGFQKRIKQGVARRAHYTGFWYDSSTDDYMVVNLRWGMCMKVEWFSFRTNAWTRLPDTGVSYAGPIENAHGVLLNEALLHWLVMSDDDLVLIIAFDVREKRLSEILPPYASGLEFEKIYLKVMGGCLCLCVIEKGHGTTMWTMKQYKVQSSWIKSFVPSFNCDLSVFYPICSTRNGGVLGSNGNTLVILNDKGELLEHHTPRQKFEGVYTESLLSQKFGGFCILYCVHTESLLSLSREFDKVTKF